MNPYRTQQRSEEPDGLPWVVVLVVTALVSLSLITGAILIRGLMI